MNTFPRWVWADQPPFLPAMRVETAPDLFVDYLRLDGVWRQHTHPMTWAESVTPEKFPLHDWLTPIGDWPAVDDEIGEWLETTYNTIGASR